MLKQKILIVEDEAIIAMELMRRLEKSGYDTLLHANSGEDAVKKATEFLPDIILMDIELGNGIDGIEAAKQITSKFDVPIIYLTAYSDENTVLRAKQTGPFGYLVKPFEQKDLETTIEVVLYKFLTEKKLKESESWLDTTLNNVIDGIVSINSEGIINFVNKVAENILGLQSNSIIGKTIHQIFKVCNYEINENKEPLIPSTLPEPFEKISGKEMILFKPDSSNVIIEISVTLIKDKRNNSIGLVLVFRDITLKKHNEELLHYKHKFERWLASLSTHFINLPIEKFDEEINKALGSIGNITNASRVSIVLISENYNYASKIFEWCADGIASNKMSFINIHVIQFPWLLSKMINDESLFIHDISFIPRIAKTEREMWLKENLKSFMAVPLRSKNKLIGWLYISSTENSNAFREEDTFLIKTAGEIIFNALERKKYELQLINSEEQYSTVFHNINDGIIYYEYLSKKVIKSNLAYQKLSGYTEEELLNLRAYDLILNEPPYNSVLNKMFEANRNYFLGERKHRRKDGTVYPVEVSASLVALNGRDVLVVVVRDITLRKKGEEALLESENKYRSLFETMAEGVIFQDGSGNILSANPSASKILGLSIEQMINQRLFTPDWKVAKEDGTLLEEINYPPIVSLRTGEPIQNAILEIYDPHNKTQRWILLNTIPQFHVNEVKPFGVFTTFSDISERKNTEVFLKKSEMELRQLNATKDKFFSIVAHDLKSPFQGLLGASSFLNENFDELDNKDVKKFIKNISCSTRNIYNHIEQLLDWSRLQSGHFEFKPEKLELLQNILYVTNLVNPTAAAKNIEIANTLEPNEHVFTDERMLNSVLQNLISNAIKFTNPEGTITISTISDDSYTTVCVQDTGIGISDEALDSIFRIDMNHSTRGTQGEEGTGLGLILCRDMIHKWGGKIWVESEINKGSSFYFTIPKA